MSFLSQDVLWWISAVELPAMAGLLTMIWKLRQDYQKDHLAMRESLEHRTAQLRDGLAAYKLEVAKSYASITDMRDLERRLVDHLLRIESKLDQTALKAEANAVRS
jgi:hypothetical protein